MPSIQGPLEGLKHKWVYQIRQLQNATIGFSINSDAFVLDNTSSVKRIKMRVKIGIICIPYILILYIFEIKERLSTKKYFLKVILFLKDRGSNCFLFLPIFTPAAVCAYASPIFTPLSLRSSWKDDLSCPGTTTLGFVFQCLDNIYSMWCKVRTSNGHIFLQEKWWFLCFP